MIRSWILALSCMMLGACSLGNDRPNDLGKEFLSAVKAKVKSPQSEAVPGATIQLGRAQLKGITEPLIRTKTEKSGQNSLLYIAQRNGNSQVWFSPDRASFTMRSGLIIQTKGLANDIYASDAPAVLALLERRGGVGPARRSIRRLDGANAQTVDVFECTISDLGSETLTILELSFNTRHFAESCKSADGSFTNDYWLDSKGILRASRQWIGQEYGSLYMERLID